MISFLLQYRETVCEQKIFKQNRIDFLCNRACSVWFYTAAATSVGAAAIEQLHLSSRHFDVLTCCCAKMEFIKSYLHENVLITFCSINTRTFCKLLFLFSSCTSSPIMITLVLLFLSVLNCVSVKTRGEKC